MKILEMQGSTTSVIIPSRSDQYLQKTVDDLLNKAKGEVEIIVVLDGRWSELRDDKRVVIVHQGTQHDNFGMRAGINAGMSIAKGEYVIKIDEHCMMDEGWDEKLKADCEDNWVVIPRRYRLDPDKWENIEDGRRPIDYMYLTNPFMRPGDKTNGLRGQEDKQRFDERKDILIDETMSWQGSCYFTKKTWWDTLFPEGLEDDLYGPFTSEAQEIGNKTWLMGGKLMVNKKTWYSHWWKGKKGKGYGFSNSQYVKHQAETERGRQYTIDYWLTTKDYKYDFNWLMEKFSPVPTWPEDWKGYILEKTNEEPN